MNYKSSRSHAIIRIQCGSFNLGIVDLAGSERMQKDGENFEETASINKSLLCLGRCLQALKQRGTNSNIVIPYRESKLTKTLIQYFNYSYKICMIAHLNKKKDLLYENVKVLEYAAIAKDIQH